MENRRTADWWPITSGIPQGLILINISTNEREELTTTLVNNGQQENARDAVEKPSRKIYTGCGIR